VPESHDGSDDSERGKGTRWMGTLSDVASEMAEGGVDGAGSAACVVVGRAPAAAAAAGTACP
jgi:hypothetical protein